MKHSRTSGMTMIEIVMYVTLFAIIVGAVVYTLISLGGAYRALQATNAINSSAQIALERMTRELRAATSVDIGGSSFGTNPGVLLFNTLDEGGNPITKEFSVASDILRLEESGIDRGPLTSARVRVSELVFRRIVNAKSEAVKIEMTLESGEGASFAEKTFNSTIVLRGSYPAN